MQGTSIACACPSQAPQTSKRQTSPLASTAQAAGCEQGEPPLHGNRGQSPPFRVLDYFVKAFTSSLGKTLALHTSAPLQAS